MELDQESSVHDWIAAYPSALALLNEFGIDTSCPGKSLGYACRQRGYDPGGIIAQLQTENWPLPGE